MRAQTTPPSMRLFALTTGTLGLLAVGILILTVTPRRQESPIAISATTSPVASAQVGDDIRAGVRTPGFAARGSVTTEVAVLRHALATPIGDGRLAIMTVDALTDGHSGDGIEVRLPSGRLATGQVIERSGDAWLIELHEHAAGHDIASERPTGSEIVTVMERPPVTVAFADVATLDVDEGIAVLDSDGDLVGICTRRRGNGKVRVIEISSDLVGATSAAP